MPVLHDKLSTLNDAKRRSCFRNVEKKLHIKLPEGHADDVEAMDDISLAFDSGNQKTVNFKAAFATTQLSVTVLLVSSQLLIAFNSTRKLS